MTRVLITNDDGVDSVGLRALAQVARERGHDVVVAAPDWDSSGASASLTAVEHQGRLLLTEHEDDELPDVAIFAVKAAPAFIVRAAAIGAFGPPPALVLSGINHGPNTGHAVLHSGTVGAALTASTFGIPAAAFSIGTGSPTHWETAMELADSVVEWIVEAETPVVVNVNAPNVPIDELTGFAPARLASFGAVQTTIAEAGAGYIKLGYEPIRADFEPGTDAAALARRGACYTFLRAVCEDDQPQLADLAGRFRARNWS